MGNTNKDPFIDIRGLITVGELREEALDGMYRLLPNRKEHRWKNGDQQIALHVVKSGDRVWWLDHPYRDFMQLCPKTVLHGTYDDLTVGGDMHRRLIRIGEAGDV